jgi:hypothetical protein
MGGLARVPVASLNQSLTGLPHLRGKCRQGDKHMTMQAVAPTQAQTHAMKWTSFQLYAIAGLLTLAFQLWVRSSQCVGIEACGLSYAKAIVWATIWPASWVVYLAGLLPALF